MGAGGLSGDRRYEASLEEQRHTEGMTPLVLSLFCFTLSQQMDNLACSHFSNCSRIFLLETRN